MSKMANKDVAEREDADRVYGRKGKWKGPYASGEAHGGNVIDEYIYRDGGGEFYLRVERTDNKQFLQAHWDGKAWQYGAPKSPKLPYYLPQLIKAAPDVPVFICEGEKDTDNVFELGLIATCASGGAGKWTADLNQWFAGRKTVYVLEDNDDAGRRHVRQVAQNLTGIVSEIRIVALPDLAEKGDVSDWLKAGGTKEKLVELCAAAPVYKADLLDPTDPMRSARALMAMAFTDASGPPLLHRHKGAYWSWTGSYYQLADDETVRSVLWTFLEKSWRQGEKGPVPFKPNRARVSDTLDALGAVTQLDKYIEPPAWLSGTPSLPPAPELLACGNGLLHLPTGAIYSPTPDFFCLSASEVIFDAAAPEPTLWLEFLKELFGEDTEAIETLQEWCGYVLAPDTGQQKILLVVGPKRSGKGTIARILTKLLGRNSVAGPTMSSLSETFGLEPLITKPLAIVSDARIGARTDKSAIVERLLSISGEDTMTVARKFRDAWHGRLMTRFMILTNELPSLSDGSGALAGRFLVLVLKNSFFGKEDPALTNKLTTELSGILRWAIAGYVRLHKRGHFITPKSAQDAVNDIELLGAPIKAFIRDCCEIGPGFEARADDLWAQFGSWSSKEGRRDTGTKAWFGRNLHSAVPGLVARKPGSGDQRALVYVGIRLALWTNVM